MQWFRVNKDQKSKIIIKLNDHDHTSSGFSPTFWQQLRENKMLSKKYKTEHWICLASIAV